MSSTASYKAAVEAPHDHSSPSFRTAMGSSWFSRRRSSNKIATTARHSTLSLPISAHPVATDDRLCYSLPAQSYLTLPTFDEPKPRRRSRPLSSWDMAFEQIYEESASQRPHSVYIPARTASMSSPDLLFQNYAIDSWQATAPAIPIRSSHRSSIPAERSTRRSPRSGARPQVRDRCSSLMSLSMQQTDVSMDMTPSLSSASSSSGENDEYPQPTSKRRSGFWARMSRTDLTIDMVKVHDGVDTRRSSSGVYTPTTFPGPSGPHPSHYPSSVYTPPGYNLYPTSPSLSPRHSVTRQAEQSPSRNVTSKLFAAVGRAQSAFTGWKRSPSIPECVTPQTPGTPQTPFSRESYFTFSPTSSDNGHVVYSASRYAETSPNISHFKAMPAPFAPVAKQAGLGIHEQDSLAKVSKGVRRKAVPKLVKDEADLRAELERIARAQVA